MKQTNRLKQKRGAATDTALVPTDAGGFDLFVASSTCHVPTQAIHEFLQGIPHRWAPEDIDRFGYRAGRMALALQLAIIRGKNADLGELRVFPVAFLEWVYSTMAPGCHWPLLSEVQTLEDSHRANRLELRKRERAAQSLQEISETAENVEVLTAIEKVREHLQHDIARLRGEETPRPAVESPK